MTSSTSHSQSPNDEALAFIAHYASQYYDPVKAKEYYERTKKLKGREAAKLPDTSKMSTSEKKAYREKQSAATAYVREKVGKAKEADLKGAAKNQEAKLAKLQKDAQESRDRIVKNLTALVESLNPENSVKQNSIPNNASPALRAYLERSNKTRNQAAKKKAVEATSAASKAAREEIRKVGEDLREAVAKARETYYANKQKTQEQYRKTLATELKNVQEKVR